MPSSPLTECLLEAGQVAIETHTNADAIRAARGLNALALGAAPPAEAAQRSPPRAALSPGASESDGDAPARTRSSGGGARGLRRTSIVPTDRGEPRVT
jgi:hypothetical protein